MNKGRRNELRDLRWKRRLKKWGFPPGTNYWLRDQSKACSCVMCKRGTPVKYKNKWVKDE